MRIVVGCSTDATDIREADRKSQVLSLSLTDNLGSKAQKEMNKKSIFAFLSFLESECSPKLTP